MKTVYGLFGNTTRIDVHRGTFGGGAAHRVQEVALKSGKATCRSSLAVLTEHMQPLCQRFVTEALKVEFVSEETQW